MHKPLWAALAVLVALVCLAPGARAIPYPGAPEERAASILATIPCNTESTQGVRYRVVRAAADSCTTTGSETNTCVCDGSNWVIEGSGGGAGHTVEEDGTPLTARSSLNFSTNITAADSGGKTVVTVPTASSVSAGVVNTSAQAFAGTKTFADGIGVTDTANFTSATGFTLPLTANASKQLAFAVAGPTGGYILNSPTFLTYDGVQQHAVLSIPFGEVPLAAGNSWLPYVDGNDGLTYRKEIDDGATPTIGALLQRATMAADVPEYTTASPPATPASGFAALWLDGDGVGGFLHFRDDAGADHELVEKTASTSLGLPYWTANGKLSFAPGWTADATTGVLTGPGIVTTASTTDDVNGLDIPQNELASGGAIATCATQGFSGTGSTAGTRRIGFGDLDSRASGTGGNFPEFCAEGAQAPIPNSATASGNLTFGSFENCIAFGQIAGSASGAFNFSGGGSTNNPAYGIAGIPSRSFALRSLTVMIRTFGTGAGWEADELLSLKVLRCGLSTSPIYTDCTEVDRLVIQKNASPSGTYGAGSRVYSACNTTPCVVSIPITGAGRASTAGDPYAEVGEANRDYFVVCSNKTDADHTVDAGTDAVSASFTSILEWWN